MAMQLRTWSLRGLTINGLGGNNGIRLQQGARLHVEGCEVSNMVNDGILIEADGAEIFVNDTLSRDNAGNGVELTASANVVIDRLRSERNGTGVYATKGSLAVRDSVVSRNGNQGFLLSTVVPGSTLVVENTMIVGNFADGILAASFVSSGTIDLVAARNTIIDNDRGVYVFGLGGYASVTDNVVKGSKGIGLFADSTAVMTASGNTVTRNASSGLATFAATMRTRTNNTVMYNNPDLEPFTTLTPLSPL